MRAERLLRILALLQSRGRITTRELAEALEISVRSVHRDMEALTLAGIPVYAERGAKGGWALSEGYRSRITGMTTDEIRSLLLLHASSIVADLGLNDQAHAAFRKLLSALPETARQDALFARERIHVDGAGWRPGRASDAALSARLQLAQEAVWQERKLRIVYRGSSSAEDSERVLLPLGLVAKTSVWYLIAASEPTDSEAGGSAATGGTFAEERLRSYRLSRVSEAAILEETFPRPEGFDLAAYWERSTDRFRASLPRYPAKIKIARPAWEPFSRERFVAIVSAVAETEDELGSWKIADAEFDTLESAVGIALKYGRSAEALAPAEFRSAVLAELEATAALYRP